MKPQDLPRIAETSTEVVNKALFETAMAKHRGVTSQFSAGIEYRVQTGEAVVGIWNSGKGVGTVFGDVVQEAKSKPIDKNDKLIKAAIEHGYDVATKAGKFSVKYSNPNSIQGLGDEIGVSDDKAGVIDIIKKHAAKWEPNTLKSLSKINESIELDEAKSVPFSKWTQNQDDDYEKYEAFFEGNMMLIVGKHKLQIFGGDEGKSTIGVIDGKVFITDKGRDSRSANTRVAEALQREAMRLDAVQESNNYDYVFMGAKVEVKGNAGKGNSKEPLVVVKIVDDQRVVVKDDYGQKQTVFIKNLVPAVVEEAIKGWKHAGSDLTKMRRDAREGAMSVKMVTLRKDGQESGMHDAASKYDSVEAARKRADDVAAMNPGRTFNYNVYVDGKLTAKFMGADTMVQESSLDEGKFILKSKDGVEKKFAKSDSADAVAWMASTQKKPKPEKTAKAPTVKTETLSLTSIFMKVMEVVSNIYPDGDPIDHIGPWCKKVGISYDMVTKACKANGYKDLYDYWNSMEEVTGESRDLDEAAAKKLVPIDKKEYDVLAAQHKAAKGFYYKDEVNVYMKDGENFVQTYSHKSHNLTSVVRNGANDKHFKYVDEGRGSDNKDIEEFYDPKKHTQESTDELDEFVPQVKVKGFLNWKEAAKAAGATVYKKSGTDTVATDIDAKKVGWYNHDDNEGFVNTLSEAIEEAYFLVGAGGINLTAATSSPSFASKQSAADYQKKYKHSKAILSAKIVNGSSDKHGFITPITDSEGDAVAESVAKITVERGSVKVDGKPVAMKFERVGSKMFLMIGDPKNDRERMAVPADQASYPDYIEWLKANWGKANDLLATLGESKEQGDDAMLYEFTGGGVVVDKNGAVKKDGKPVALKFEKLKGKLWLMVGDGDGDQDRIEVPAAQAGDMAAAVDWLVMSWKTVMKILATNNMQEGLHEAP